MTDPYRQMVPITQTKKKSVGLILAPIPPKPHKCSKPGWGWRVLFWWLPQITTGVMFRCPKCKTVWRFCHQWKSFTWLESSMEEWKRVGGIE